MCDYSLMHVKSRAAAVDDKLVTQRFKNSLSQGFASPEDADTAVCVLPGTEIAFDAPLRVNSYFDGGTYIDAKIHDANVGRFRQVDVENQYTHHDALELPDGTIVKLHHIEQGQCATVLQLPTTEKQREMQAAGETTERLEVVA